MVTDTASSARRPNPRTGNVPRTRPDPGLLPRLILAAAAAIAVTAAAPAGATEAAPPPTPSPAARNVAPPPDTRTPAWDLAAELAGKGNTKISYIKHPRPQYPAESQRIGEEGLVMVRALIDTSGHVERVALYRSSGFPRLDNAALDAVRLMQVSPYLEDGMAMRALVIVPVRFAMTPPSPPRPPAKWPDPPIYQP